MAQAEVIKEFLVALGYDIKASEQQKFSTFITGATKRVVALGAAAKAASLAVQAAVVSMSSQLEDLYWASQRTKASVENIKAFGYAASQMGGSVQGAMGTLEAFAAFLRSSPGAGGLVRSLGVATEQAGRLRDTADVLQDLGARFRDMPYFQARAYASAMGIDERTLMALINGMGQFSGQYRGLLRSMRVDLPTATRDANALMTEFRGLTATFSVLGTKIISGVSRRITEDIGRLRTWIVANADRIASGVEMVIRVVLGLMDAVTRAADRTQQIFQRIGEWYDGLSPRAKQLTLAAAGLTAAWIALNAGFLASPLGRILAIGAAIAALVEDYITWKEGGQSLIDWSKWEPGIQMALDAMKKIGTWLDEAVIKVGGWENAFTVLLAFVAGRFAIGMIAAFTRIGTAGALALIGPFARLPAAFLRLFGLGGLATIGAVIAGMWPGSTQDREHEYSQPGGDRIQGFNRNIAEGQRGLAERAMAYFMANGYSREQASGLVAQIEKESGFNVDAFNGAGGGEGAMGILQWRGDRIRRFRERYGRDPRGAPFDQQLEFMVWELNNSEGPAGAAIRGARTAGEAGSIASRLYVRPGVTEPERAAEATARARAAEAWNREFSPPAPSAGPSNPDQGYVWQPPQATPNAFRSPPLGGGSVVSGVSMSQETQIIVNGAGDPRAVGNMVAGEQSRVNADLIRNMQGAAR